MSTMIELTVAYDSTNAKVNELQLVKALVALQAIQAVTMGQEKSRFCEVALVPSLPAFAEGDQGESVAQDQRVLLVLEPYHEIRAILEKHRGIEKCVPVHGT